MQESIREVHTTKALSSSAIVELIDKYPDLEVITCSPSVYERTPKNYIEALEKLDIRVEKKYEWGAKSQTEGVEKALTALLQEEAKAEPDPDRLCGLSGEMLGSVFVPRPEDPWSSVLRAVGAGLGRFIYWMDAWEDYDDDIKKGRFNPLSVYRNRPDYEEFCRETLELLIADAAESFEVLPLEQDLDLLRNVIYSGVWQRYNLKTEQRKRKEDAHAE